MSLLLTDSVPSQNLSFVAEWLTGLLQTDPKARTDLAQGYRAPFFSLKPSLVVA